MQSTQHRAAVLQREYYERTADDYARLHQGEDSGHDRALKIIVTLLRDLQVGSLLDVGAGTGRALRHIASERPDLILHGIEPVAALISQAERAGVPTGTIRVGTGESLPFEDSSVDVVTAFGVLHHVRDPSAVIREMTRVAKHAVFISDSNRFGHGSPLARFVKIAIASVGLWRAFNFVKTRGRGYSISEGDGLAYSYSVFDTLPLLREWTPRLSFFEMETADSAAGPFQGPLGNAYHLLIGAIRS